MRLALTSLAVFGAAARILCAQPLELSPAAINAAVAGWARFSVPLEVSGFATPGDGGSHRMLYDPANRCGAGGHDAASLNGVTCVDSAVPGQVGSWNIDWSSVGHVASPCLFESAAANTNDTNALQAAIGTGRTVDLSCKDNWTITHDIVMAMQRQIIRGRGRDLTWIYLGPASGFSKGAFVSPATLTSSFGGADFRDFSVIASQPTAPANSAALDQYPPIFWQENTPHLRLTRIGCYQGLICLDMRGNSGGAEISSLQFNAFSVGIEIDGAADTVEIDDPAWGPFTMSAAQMSIFYPTTATTGIASGRMDHLVIKGGTFFGGQAMRFFQGATGPTFGNVAGTDFDNFSGIKIAAGTITCSSCTFTGGRGDSSLVSATGGQLDISASNFGVTSPTPPLIDLPPGSTAVVSITTSTLNTYANDVNHVFMASGVLMMSGDQFLREASAAYNRHTISTTGGRLILTGNYGSDRGAGRGSARAINLTRDGANRIVGNAFPGWGKQVGSNVMPNSLMPTPAGGIYAGN